MQAIAPLQDPPKTVDSCSVPSILGTEIDLHNHVYKKNILIHKRRRKGRGGEGREGGRDVVLAPGKNSRLYEYQVQNPVWRAATPEKNLK